MTFFELFLIAFALAMDAFAVSVCKGMALKKFSMKQGVVTGLYFGIFQTVMPFAGYLLSKSFEVYINRYAHWVGFALLMIIGLKMIKDSFSDGGSSIGESLAFKSMALLALATSIDALAVGVTLVYSGVNIYFAISVIGIIAFALSFAGVLVGSIFGSRMKIRSTLIGGLILVAIGVKILVEHYWF